MSRSGYCDDLDNWSLIRWRGAVKSAMGGSRGQAALREIVEALDSLPEKRLAAGSLETANGEYCTLGALGRARGLDMENIDPEDREAVAEAFGVAEALAAEIMFMNDEWIDDWKTVQVEICGPMRPNFPHFERHRRTLRIPDERAAEQRWQYMRDWVSRQVEAY